MDFNNFIFPAPTPSYTVHSLDKLLWIPRTRFFSMKNIVKSMGKFENYSEAATSTNSAGSPKQNQIYIPCHYQKYDDTTRNFILFFHGNAEDIGLASNFTKRLGMALKADILSVEYPGYGLYEGEANAKTIIEDAEIIFDFLTAEVGIEPEKIILMGRSIGSGPATHLAANRSPGALVLMSPYTSIRAVVKDMAGHLVSTLVAERFSNIEEIEKADCPCLFIHGKKDKVIPWEHSQSLFMKCKAATLIHLSETMTHNTFKLAVDIVNPIKKFLKPLEFKDSRKSVKFPEYVSKVPQKEFKFAEKEVKEKTKNMVAAKVAGNVVYEL